MSRKYRPSNGTEGRVFESFYCIRCINDPMSRNYKAKTGCRILADALIYEIDDNEYPKQWIYNDENVPTCTSFKDLKDKKKYTRKYKQKECFEGLS